MHYATLEPGWTEIKSPEDDCQPPKADAYPRVALGHNGEQPKAR